MNTNDSNRSWQSPPLVTHSPYTPGVYPTQAMPSAASVDALSTALAQPRRRRNAGAWVAAIATTVVSLGVGFAAGTVSGTSTPGSCMEALEYADELTDHTGELGDLAGESIEAAAAWDADALDALTVEVEDLRVRWDETLAAYESAAESCRAAGGEL